MIRLPAAQPLLSGSAGVDIFFVLSGCLIAHILLRDQQQQKRLRLLAAAAPAAGPPASLALPAPRYLLFLWRRLLRLFPAYAAAVVLTIIFLSPYDQDRLCKKHWYENLLFISNYAGEWKCMPHTWTIATEFQFYLLSPVLFVLLVDHTSRDRLLAALRLPASPQFMRSAAWVVGVVLVLALLAVGLRIYFWYHLGALDFGTRANDKVYTRMGPYLFGMALELLLARGAGASLGREVGLTDGSVEQQLRRLADRRRRRLLVLGDLAVLTLLMLLSWFGCGDGLYLSVTPRHAQLNLALKFAGRTVFGFCIAYLVFMMRVGRLAWLRRALSWPVFVPIARLSYVAYLVQFLVIDYTYHPEFAIKLMINDFPTLGLVDSRGLEMGGGGGKGGEREERERERARI